MNDLPDLREADGLNGGTFVARQEGADAGESIAPEFEPRAIEEVMIVGGDGEGGGFR